MDSPLGLNTREEPAYDFPVRHSQTGFRLAEAMPANHGGAGVRSSGAIYPSGVIRHGSNVDGERVPEPELPTPEVAVGSIVPDSEVVAAVGCG